MTIPSAAPAAGAPATLPERPVRAPKQYGQHQPFRNASEAIGKLRGTAPPERTLHEGGVTQDRVDAVAGRIAASALTDAPPAAELIARKAVRQRKALKEAANQYGAMAYKGAFGANGLIARGVTQATTTFKAPAALSGAGRASEAPSPSAVPTPPPSAVPSPPPSASPSTGPSAVPSTAPSAIPSPPPSASPVYNRSSGNQPHLRGLQVEPAAQPSLGDRTRGVNATVFFNVISSAVHAAGAASAAPDDRVSQLVKGPNAQEVRPEESAASFAPFGRRAVKDMASVRTVTTALSAGVGQIGGAAFAAGRHIETAANSLGAYAVGRRAAAGTAEIVFTRRAEADWSVVTPIQNRAGDVIGSVTAHPEPVARPDGRVELGRIKIHDGVVAHEVTVHRPSVHGPTIDVAPVDASPEARPKLLSTGDRVGLWTKALVGDWSGDESFIKKAGRNLPTSSTLSKMGAQASAIAVAAYAQPLISEAVKAVLERVGAPPTLSPYLATLATGIAADAIAAGIFVPGFQTNGDPVAEGNDLVRTAAEATGKVMFASTPILNAAGTGSQEHHKNVVMDDVTFARSAATETELLAILQREIPYSVAVDAGERTLEIDSTDAIAAYSRGHQPAPAAAAAAAPASPRPSIVAPASVPGSPVGSDAAASRLEPFEIEAGSDEES